MFVAVLWVSRHPMLSSYRHKFGNWWACCTMHPKTVDFNSQLKISFAMSHHVQRKKLHTFLCNQKKSQMKHGNENIWEQCIKAMEITLVQFVFCFFFALRLFPLHVKNDFNPPFFLLQCWTLCCDCSHLFKWNWLLYLNKVPLCNKMHKKRTLPVPFQFAAATSQCEVTGGVCMISGSDWMKSLHVAGGLGELSKLVGAGGSVIPTQASWLLEEYIKHYKRSGERKLGREKALPSSLVSKAPSLQGLISRVCHGCILMCVNKWSGKVPNASRTNYPSLRAYLFMERHFILLWFTYSIIRSICQLIGYCWLRNKQNLTLNHRENSHNID